MVFILKDNHEIVVDIESTLITLTHILVIKLDFKHCDHTKVFFTSYGYLLPVSWAMLAKNAASSRFWTSMLPTVPKLLYALAAVMKAE